MRNRGGLDHLGIQVESSSELEEVHGRLQAADRPVLEEVATTCCYATSEKSWIADPDGIVVDACFTPAGGCGDLLAAAPRWVAEPLTDWLTGRWDECRTYRYLVTGVDRQSLHVERR